MLRIKQVLGGQDQQKVHGEDDQAKNGLTRETEQLRKVFAKSLQTKVINAAQSLELVERDDFFDGLFMKFKMKCPPKETMEQLKLLLCVQFGPNAKEPSFFLIPRLERLLYDLDYVYVNLVKILREPDHEKNQVEALKRLQRRFDFVARGISKEAQAQPRGAAAAISKVETTSTKQQRPMSSKPKNLSQDSQPKQVKAVAAKQVVREEHPDDFDSDVEDEVAGAGRQKGEEKAFKLPDDNQDEFGDDFEEDFEDEEANVIGAGKTHQVSDDEIDDEYEEDDVDPPKNETNTLKRVNGGAPQVGRLGQDEASDRFVEEDIVDEYD